MKKLISILLVSILCFDTCGFIFYYKIAQNQIKHEMKKKIRSSLPEDKLEVINIPLSKTNIRKMGIEFIDKNEFRYHGIMYDIVKRVYNKNSMIVFCVNDKKETELFNCLLGYVKNRIEKEKNSLQANAIKMIKVFTFSSIFMTHQILLNIDFRWNFVIKYTIFFKSIILEPIFRPPIS
jgi:hypothetical protein